MSPDQYNLLVVSLPTLSAEQRVELVNRIKLLDFVSAKEYSGKQEFGDRVLQIVCTTLRKHNVETPSVVVLRKSSAYVNAKGKLQDLQTYIEQASRSRMVQDGILRTAIDLLYFDLVQWKGIAISSHTLLKQIHRIPSVLNRSFPGYGQSGLLAKLVKGA